ncbi:uncharacterized protein LOC124167663 [Ischnura elegans]|uniref:uncharacterized protein LOC124167663 n=1 Tax=Ischnura elegans TaxID=197161 RepID=UPI001ED89632|nr:uncharacterized protein LOC124167663 [Ischnura elegans]
MVELKPYVLGCQLLLLVTCCSCCAGRARRPTPRPPATYWPPGWGHYPPSHPTLYFPDMHRGPGRFPEPTPASPGSRRCSAGERCVDLRTCPTYFDTLNHRHRGAPSAAQLRKLREANCGFHGASAHPLVCCPQENRDRNHNGHPGEAEPHHGAGSDGDVHHRPHGDEGSVDSDEDNTVRHGDTPVHHGDTPMHHGDTPMHHGDTPMHHGDGPMHHGDTPLHHGDGTVPHGDLPVHHGDHPFHPGVRSPHHGDNPVHPGTNGHGFPGMDSNGDHHHPGGGHHSPGTEHGMHPDGSEHHGSSEEGMVPSDPHGCHGRGTHRSSTVNHDCPEVPELQPHSGFDHPIPGEHPDHPGIGRHEPFHPESSTRRPLTTGTTPQTTGGSGAPRPIPTTTRPPATRPTAAGRRPTSSSVRPPATPGTAATRPRSSTTPSPLIPGGDDSDVGSRRAAREVKRRLLPEAGACGISVDERIVGGREANLGAFPWIARLGYQRRNSNDVVYRCGGTLINSRYVITAAHCVTKLPSGMRLVTVRLGEHDERTAIDCDGDGVCADPVQDFSPENATPHRSYDSPKYRHDVGLVRLNRDANITTYVSPICLPFDSLTTKNYTGLRSSVAGWGVTEIGSPTGSPTLRFVDVRVVPPDTCIEAFRQDADVEPASQICAGGQEDQDSCEGDSGGPLSRQEDISANASDSSPRHVLIGVVSFGSRLCGSVNMPGVYARVTNYLDWILDNIREALPNVHRLPLPPLWSLTSQESLSATVFRNRPSLLLACAFTGILFLDQRNAYTVRMTVSRICGTLPLIFLLSIHSTTIAQIKYGGLCRTPDDLAGECIPLAVCEPLRALITPPDISKETKEFLRQSQCGYVDVTRGNRPLVCCPTDDPLPEEDDSTEDRGVDYSQHPNWSLLMPDICGSDVSDKIIGGTVANLKQYPWLALLQYQTEYGLQFLCGGALIGNRYVLTAAHCVTGLKFRVKLVSLRLGEQNIDTDPDCISKSGKKLCGEPVQVFKIAKVIRHPQYQPSSRDRHHDIALIRLDREAQITDYVIPICLPTGAAVQKRYEAESMIVAGWGRTEKRVPSPVKLWVSVPVVPLSDCQAIYRQETSLIPDQMCAGGKRGKDSCRGDSGGPLMTVEMLPGRQGAHWTAVGVVSRGPEYCGSNGLPAIYTRVGAYMQWILDSITP